jgi:hypothetical protein
MQKECKCIFEGEELIEVYRWCKIHRHEITSGFRLASDMEPDITGGHKKQKTLIWTGVMNIHDGS